MPIISCPQCQTKLNVSDKSLGKNGRCPKCGNVFTMHAESSAVSASPMPELPPAPSRSTAPVAATPLRPVDNFDDEFETDPPPHDDFDDADLPDYARWSRTRGGLRMVSIAVLVILIGSILVQSLTVVTVLSTLGQAPRPQNPGADILGGATMALGCAAIIALIVGLIGVARTCSAPDRTAAFRAKVALATFVGVFVVAIGIGVAVGLMAGQQAVGRQAAGGQAGLQRLFALGIVGIAGAITALALGVMSFVFWILFHVAVGKHFRNPALVRSAYSYLVGFFIIYALSLAYGVAIGATFSNMADLNQLRMQLILISAGSIVQILLIYGWYLVLCHKTIAVMTPPPA
jgi:predicted Zn finger-like uncharacterized protein